MTRLLSRRLRILLIGSLALNLLFVGLTAGVILRGPPMGAGKAPRGWDYVGALPDAHRRAVMKTFFERRDDWDAHRRGFREHRGAVTRALTAEPFDAALVADLIGREQKDVRRLTEQGTAVLIRQIGKMSPQERADYAARLERRRGHDGHRDRRPHKHD